MEVLTGVQCWILKKAFGAGGSRAAACSGKSRIGELFGAEFLDRVAGKTVIDFGCGDGLDSIELARRQAGEVIGLDIRDEVLHRARRSAMSAGLAERCHFVRSTSRLADFIVSIDAFEHFADPAEVLRIISTLLKPEGEVMVSFGPTWYHPMGGHLFSVFSWAHLLFSEEALIRWRSSFKNDGATCFSEVAGGLNRMTIRKFETIVNESPLRFAAFEAVPIRRLRRFHNRWTREFTTAIVRCRLVRRTAAPLALKTHA